MSVGLHGYDTALIKIFFLSLTKKSRLSFSESRYAVEPRYTDIPVSRYLFQYMDIFPFTNRLEDIRPDRGAHLADVSGP